MREENRIYGKNRRRALAGMTLLLALILIPVLGRISSEASETENTVRLIDDRFYVCQGEEKLCGPFELIIGEGYYNDGVVRYMDNDRWGFLSVEPGVILTEPKEYEDYTGIEYMGDETFVVKDRDGMYGVVDAWDGELLIQVEYTDISQVTHYEEEDDDFDIDEIYIMTKPDGTIDLFASGTGKGFRKIGD